MPVVECRKVRYPSRVAALVALAKIHLTHARHANAAFREAPVRAYQCDRCEGRPWHLTSMPEAGAA